MNTVPFMMESGPDSCVSVNLHALFKGFLISPVLWGKMLHFTAVLFVSLITIQCQGRVCVCVLV